MTAIVVGFHCDIITNQLQASAARHAAWCD